MNQKTFHVSKYLSKTGETRWLYRFELARDSNGKRKSVFKRGFKTKAAATNAAAIAFTDCMVNNRVIAKEASYSAVLDYWLESMDMRIKPETKRKYTERVGRIKEFETIVRKPILNITHGDLQKILDSLFDSGTSRNSLGNYRALLSSSIKYAIAENYISSSPAVGLTIKYNKLPKTSTKKHPNVYLSREERNAIFDLFPDGTASYLPIRTSLEFGTRIGETFAITFDDIDFENKTLSITRQIQWQQNLDRSEKNKTEKNGTRDSDGGFWYFSPPKYNSFRKIDISDAFCEYLKKLRERVENDKLSLNSVQENLYQEYHSEYPISHTIHGLNGDEIDIPESEIMNRVFEGPGENPVRFIMVREDGSFITPRTMQYATRRIKENGCERFTFHSLRHTHTSLLREQKFDAVYIMNRLGHKKVTLHQETYSHITEKISEEGIKKLNELLE